MIIRIFSVLAFITFVSGCTIHQSIGDSFGSSVSKPKGQNFKEVGPRWDFDHNALLYIYRPASQWANDEFEAPSFNVNDKRLFNIKGGSYTWYELKPGDYDVIMRRGLMGFEGINNLVLKTVAQLSLQVEAGETYYLRYSEVDSPNDEHQVSSVGAVGEGPLKLVSSEFALTELPVTKMMHHGRDLLVPRNVAEDTALEQVFDGKIDQDAKSEKASKKSKKPDANTKEEWWPF